jgi:hypothetical protein
MLYKMLPYVLIGILFLMVVSLTVYTMYMTLKLRKNVMSLLLGSLVNDIKFSTYIRENTDPAKLREFGTRFDQQLVQITPDMIQNMYDNPQRKLTS